MLYIVANTNPDIDRVACAIAYSELLDKTGTKSEAVYTGTLTDETEFVKNYLGVFGITLKDNLRAVINL